MLFCLQRIKMAPLSWILCWFCIDGKWCPTSCTRWWALATTRRRSESTRSSSARLAPRECCSTERNNYVHVRGVRCHDVCCSIYTQMLLNDVMVLICRYTTVRHDQQFYCQQLPCSCYVVFYTLFRSIIVAQFEYPRFPIHMNLYVPIA